MQKWPTLVANVSVCLLITIRLQKPKWVKHSRYMVRTLIFKLMEKIIAVRLSAEDKEAIEKLASKNRLSISAYVRQQLFNQN